MLLGQKRKCCGECKNCKRDDCGKCKFCKDKAKFGGPNRKKQCCELKKCLKVKCLYLIFLLNHYKYYTRLSQQMMKELYQSVVVLIQMKFFVNKEERDTQ